MTAADETKGKAAYNFELRDYQNDELPGAGAFARDATGQVFHTCSAYGHGDERLIGAHHYLDLAPKGRNENGPNFDLTDWVRHHDRYKPESPRGGTADCCAAPPERAGGPQASKLGSPARRR